MSYRPITDTWFLARAKMKGGRRYYGAFPGGFAERARALLGVHIDQPVLHVCAGAARFYPYDHAFGPHDRTLDLDPATDPDFCQDAREPFPHVPESEQGLRECIGRHGPLWPAILIDPPYTEADAEEYEPGAECFPSPNLLLKNALAAVRPGGRVGMLHYILPSPPKGARFIAAVGVMVGFNNRIRVFSVFERALVGLGCGRAA